MQEVNINLGTGAQNTFAIDTNSGKVDPKLGPLSYTGKLALDTGASTATVNLISLGGHTSVTSHGGSANIVLDDTVKHTLQQDQGLLTIGTDVPQAVVDDLADGSPKGISFGVGTLGTTQLQILATGGTYQLSFNGKTPTVDLAYDLAGGPTADTVTTTLGQKGITSQVDQLKLGANGGTFKLVIDIGNGPKTTGDISYNADPNTGNGNVKSAIEAIDPTLSGKVTVTGHGTSADPYAITFDTSFGNPGMLVDGRKLTLATSLQAILESLQSLQDFIKKFDLIGGHVSVAKLGTIYRVNLPGPPLQSARRQQRPAGAAGRQ